MPRYAALSVPDHESFMPLAPQARPTRCLK
jgi:hypothetical protein